MTPPRNTEPGKQPARPATAEDSDASSLLGAWLGAAVRKLVEWLTSATTDEDSP